MNTAHLIELVGYIGSALVLVSFLMTSVFKLRVINTIGSVIFMIYALIIRSYPTALMNFCLVLINLHFLWKMRRQGKEYELLRVDTGDVFLSYLLNRYDEDIRNCFPGLSIDMEGADHAYITCAGDTPAGVFLGKETESGLDILLDYSTPSYRDFSLGEFLMQHLKEDGISTLTYRGPDEHHTAYLSKMGFQKTADGYKKLL